MSCLRQFLTCILPVTTLLFLFGCDRAPPTENRSTGDDEDYEVTPEILAGATLYDRTGKDSRYDDLRWEFQEDTFLITAGVNGIPPTLANRLLPEGMHADVISGKWTVNGNVITFTEVTTDGNRTDQPPRTLQTFITPVLRIEAGHQYKFSREPSLPAAKQNAATSDSD